MANIASQKKRIARTERERQENLRFRSSVKTYFRRLEAAVQSGDADVVTTSRLLRWINSGSRLPSAGFR